MNKSKSTKATQSVRFLIITALFSLLLMYLISEDMERVGQFVRGTGLLGLFLCTILFGILGASVIPSEPLTVLLAAIYGPLEAMLATSIGNLLAATVEYYIGTKIGDATSFTEKKDKLPWGLNRLPIDSPLLLIGGRLIPGYGSKLISVLSGVYRVRITRYLWTTLIPTFIGSAITSYGGSGILNLVRAVQS